MHKETRFENIAKFCGISYNCQNESAEVMSDIFYRIDSGVRIRRKTSNMHVTTDTVLSHSPRQSSSYAANNLR